MPVAVDQQAGVLHQQVTMSLGPAAAAAGAVLPAPALLLLLEVHTRPAAAHDCCCHVGQASCCDAGLRLLLLLLLGVLQRCCLPRPCCSIQAAASEGCAVGTRGCAAASLPRTWGLAGCLGGLHGRIVTTVHMRGALPGRSAGR
jgi:hypothetical protein